MNHPTLHILGKTLNENATPTEAFLEILKQCRVIIGESKRILQRTLGRLELNKDIEIFALDNQNPREKKELESALTMLTKSNGSA